METPIRVKRSTGPRMFLACMAGALLMAINCSSLHAQSSTAAAFDPGPRPVGTTPNVDCGPSSKFTGNLIPPNCIDIAQPPNGGQSAGIAVSADGAGNIINGASPLIGMWFQGLTVFETKASVTQQTNSAGAPSTILGLGPSFNGESCFECHSQPTVGGSSSGQVTIPQASGTKTFSSQIDPLTFTTTGFTQNPEITTATDSGATNTIPCFLTKAGCSGTSFFLGPIVETRFIQSVPAGTADGVRSNTVAELFVIAGRHDTPIHCSINQVDTGTQFQKGNAIFRIPTPTFGLGLVENTSEITLNNNVVSSAFMASQLGLGPINGILNRVGNDDTTGRFGWKAQNGSLLTFAGEAANVEMGVTNELFPHEKTAGNGGCSPNNAPEDQTLVVNPTPTDKTNSSQSSVVENDAVFMRLNGAPSQCNWDSQAPNGVAQCKPLDSDVIAGSNLFGNTANIVTGMGPNGGAGIGCVLCHSDFLMTDPSATAGLSKVGYSPFSDFALHHMGAGDADFITQGLAGGDQFRTAPLWGAGQRLFFMHDGRATNLVQAIADHCLPASATPDTVHGFPASEACTVISNFNHLTVTQQQQILKFLRSL